MSQETRLISSIRSARAALGWNQPELAKRAGISLVALARLEAGLVSPRFSTVSKIKQALEREGVRIAEDYPVGGYTLTVSQEALQVGRNMVGDEASGEG